MTPNWRTIADRRLRGERVEDLAEELGVNASVVYNHTRKYARVNRSRCRAQLAILGYLVDQRFPKSTRAIADATGRAARSARRWLQLFEDDGLVEVVSAWCGNAGKRWVATEAGRQLVAERRAA